MKRNFSVGCLLISTALMSVGSYAAADGEHCDMAKEHSMMDGPKDAAYLQKTLQLSDEQTAKVKKILDNRNEQRKVLMDKYQPQFDAFHADMKSLHEQTNSQLNTVLTPKQQLALAAKKEKHEHMGDPMHGDRDDDGPHKEMPGK